VSTWDDRLLGEILHELSAVELDFSLEVTGFSMAEIDLRIEQSSVLSTSRPDPADELANCIGEPPVTRPGDPTATTRSWPDMAGFSRCNGWDGLRCRQSEPSILRPRRRGPSASPTIG
jgi:hypothetical protein